MSSMDIDKKGKQRTFVNPLISFRLQKGAFAFFFVILPVLVILSLIQFLRRNSLEINSGTIVLLIGFCFILLIIVVLFIHVRRYYPFKITTDDLGLRVLGPLKQLYMPWDDIVAIDVLPVLRGIIEVRTKKDSFCFIQYMKNEDAEFPLLVNMLTSPTWIYPGDIEKPLCPGNCPLLIEIKQRLKDRGINIDIKI